MADTQLLSFDCPRCGRPAEEPFYGPCGACVVALRATQGLDHSDVRAAEYEPKMNVTPNAVATKD